MILKIFLQETDGRTHPHHPWIRNEEVSSDEQGKFLFPRLSLPVDRIDLIISCVGRRQGLEISGTPFPHQLTVNTIRLEYMAFDNLGLRRNLRRQSLVNRRQFRILRCINDRLPSHSRKIFREFDPSLHPGSPGRRPIVCDYQNPFHHAIESLSNPKKITW